MAEQVITLAPGESKVVSFEAIPNEAKSYLVSVDGLTGSFRAVAPVYLDYTFIDPTYGMSLRIGLLSAKVEQITDPVFPPYIYPSGQQMPAWTIPGTFDKISLIFSYSLIGLGYAYLGLRGKGYLTAGLQDGMAGNVLVCPGAGTFTAIFVPTPYYKRSDIPPAQRAWAEAAPYYGATFLLNTGPQLGFVPYYGASNIELEIGAGRAKGVFIGTGSVFVATKPYTPTVIPQLFVALYNSETPPERPSWLDWPPL